jgi:hypothetical protein
VSSVGFPCLQWQLNSRKLGHCGCSQVWMSKTSSIRPKMHSERLRAPNWVQCNITNPTGTSTMLSVQRIIRGVPVMVQQAFWNGTGRFGAIRALRCSILPQIGVDHTVEIAVATVANELRLDKTEVNPWDDLLVALYKGVLSRPEGRRSVSGEEMEESMSAWQESLQAWLV